MSKPILNPIPDLQPVISELTGMAREGLGQQWQTEFVRNALMSSFNPNQTYEQAGSRMLAGGMEYSGAYRAKLPGMIASEGAGIMMSKAVEAKGISDQAAMGASSELRGVRLQQAQMQMQRDIAEAQLQQSKKTTWDYFVDVAQIAGAFT